MITFYQLILVLLICQLFSVAREVYFMRYLDETLSREQWIKNKQYRALQRIERESSADSVILWGVEVSKDKNRIYALRGGEYQKHRYEGWETDQHFDRMLDNIQARKQYFYNNDVSRIDRDTMLSGICRSEGIAYSKMRYIGIWYKAASMWDKILQRKPERKGFLFIAINTSMDGNKFNDLRDRNVFISEINALKKTINDG